MPPPTYFALIGDLVSSREMEDRARIQVALAGAVEEANRDLGEAFAAPLKITAGDEVQVLLEDPAPVLDLMVRMADALHPVRLAWGLGRGALSTELTEDVAMADGPCLHRARDAVDRAGADDAWLRAEGIPEPVASALQALVNLMHAVRAEWTDTRRAYVRAARTHTQTEVAERFGVNDSTVSRALARAHFRRILEAERATRGLLVSLASPGRADRDPGPAP